MKIGTCLNLKQSQLARKSSSWLVLKGLSWAFPPWLQIKITWKHYKKWTLRSHTRPIKAEFLWNGEIGIFKNLLRVTPMIDQKLLQELQNLKAELKLGGVGAGPTQSALEEVAHKQSTSFTKGRLSGTRLSLLQQCVSCQVCHHKVPQSGWFKQARKCCLTVWRLDIQRTKVLSRLVPSEGCKRKTCFRPSCGFS